MIEGIIFDLDGVLVDARPWHYEALNVALMRSGYAPIQEDQHERRFNGLPTRTKLRMLGIKGSDMDVICREKQRCTIEIITARCQPDSRLRSVLKGLSGRYALAVASNAVRETVEHAVLMVGIHDLFDALLSNQDIVRPKPAPDIYIAAAKALDLDPRQCLAVEDNRNGIASACLAGAMVMPVDSPVDVTLESIGVWIETYSQKEG